MLDLETQDAFDGRLPPASDNLRLESLPQASIAGVIARKDVRAKVAAALPAALNLKPFDGIGAATGDGAALVATGPEAWIAVGYEGGLLHDRLQKLLHGAAAVTDLSGAYALLRLGGPSAEDILTRLVFIDLHPRCFPPGSAAGANMAHVSVVLWRRTVDCFELAIPRSFVPAAAHGLVDALGQIRPG